MREFKHTGNQKVLRSRENKPGCGRLIPLLFAFLGFTLSGCDRGETERPSWMLSECPQCEDQEWTSCLDGIDNDQDQLTIVPIQTAGALPIVAVLKMGSKQPIAHALTELTTTTMAMWIAMIMAV